MNKISRSSIIYISFAILLLAVCGLFVYLSFGDYGYLYFAPAAIALFGALASGYLFIKNTYIGRNSYKIVNDKLVVERRERILCVADRNDIHDLVFVFSIGSEDEVHYLSFSAGNQRFYVNMLAGENKRIRKFFKGMEYKETRNLIFPLIEMFTS